MTTYLHIQIAFARPMASINSDTLDHLPAYQIGRQSLRFSQSRYRRSGSAIHSTGLQVGQLSI